MGKREEYGILPENWEVIDNLDMTRSYTDEEIEDIYNQVFHMDDEKQRKAMHEYETLYNPFGSRFVKRVLSDDDEEIKLFAYKRAFIGGKFNDTMFKKMILYLKGKISQEELNKYSFIEMFKERLDVRYI